MVNSSPSVERGQDDMISTVSRQQQEMVQRYLAESYHILAALGDASRIVNVGAYPGQLLLDPEGKEEGLAVLARSLEAFEMLGQGEMARELAAVIHQA